MSNTYGAKTAKSNELERLRAENAQLREELAHTLLTVDTLMEKENDRTIREADNLKKLHALEMLATKDKMKGLLNRHGFEDAMKQHMSYVTRVSHVSKLVVTPSTLVFIDLDRFKPLNDLFSHRTGDIMLMKFGRALKSALRPTDYVARIGGDEFVLLLKDVGDVHSAESVVEKIHEAVKLIEVENADMETLEIFYRAVGRRHAMGFSTGYFVIKNAELDVDQMIDLAEHDVPKLNDVRRGQYSSKV